MRLSEEQARRVSEVRGSIEVLLRARAKYVDRLDVLVRDIEACNACIEDEIRDLTAYLLEADDED